MSDSVIYFMLLYLLCQGEQIVAIAVCEPFVKKLFLNKHVFKMFLILFDFFSD